MARNVGLVVLIRQTEPGCNGNVFLLTFVNLVRTFQRKVRKNIFARCKTLFSLDAGSFRLLQDDLGRPACTPTRYGKGILTDDGGVTFLSAATIGCVGVALSLVPLILVLLERTAT